MSARKIDAARVKTDDEAKEVFRRLKKLHADAHCELNFKNALELLIATVLSAQCTDVRVNLVTKTLFQKFKRPGDYLKCSVKELEDTIRSTGFFRQKAKAIRGAMQQIVEKHGGQVPDAMEALIKLPGVGRKTASVVLGNAFDKPGLPVDTHVKRLSLRIGLTNHEDPLRVESDLGKIFRPKDWCLLSHVLIFHGRRVCKARKPDCPSCPLTDVCRYYQTAIAPEARA